jgi:hypothetical protein
MPKLNDRFILDRFCINVVTQRDYIAYKSISMVFIFKFPRFTCMTMAYDLIVLRALTDLQQ